jgi:hypothetical protein
MIWQDVIIFIANILFGYSLIYQVYKGYRDKKGYLSKQASFFTALGLYALTIVYFTLSLFLSTIISFFNGTMWLILLIQRFVYKSA